MDLPITHATVTDAFRDVLPRFAERVSWHPENREFFLSPPGREPYALLSALAHALPPGARIADVGTYRGVSAVALASNPRVTVTSYDIMSVVPTDPDMASKTLRAMPNVQLVVRDAFECLDDILNADLISLDIDPHNGIDETRFMGMLQERGYKGLVVCDDIHLNEGMRAFWRRVAQPKFDVSAVGHYSGTGLVVFDEARWRVKGGGAVRCI